MKCQQNEQIDAFCKFMQTDNHYNQPCFLSLIAYTPKHGGCRGCALTPLEELTAFPRLPKGGEKGKVAQWMGAEGGKRTGRGG